MSQASTASIEQARFQQGVEEKDGVLVRHVGHIVFTLAGFLLAVAANVLVPQVSSVPLDTYRVGILLLNRNGLYRIVLFAIAFIYLVSGIVSTRNETRRLHFDNRSAFRFAMGIALLLWDVFGTKYQLLQQPFFPGPSQVLESFLIEGAYIFSNPAGDSPYRTNPDTSGASPAFIWVHTMLKQRGTGSGGAFFLPNMGLVFRPEIT